MKPVVIEWSGGADLQRAQAGAATAHRRTKAGNATGRIILKPQADGAVH